MRLGLLGGYEYSQYILSRQDPFVPIRFYQNELKAEGICTKYFYTHKNRDVFEVDTLLIANRYFYNRGSDISEVKSFLEKIRTRKIQIYWFDMSDSTGSFDFELMDYVDCFLKKQLHADREFYLVDNYDDRGVRCWIHDDRPSLEEGLLGIKSIKGVTSDQLHKLKLAWNIGLTHYSSDTRYLGLFINSLRMPPRVTTPKKVREYLTVHRGSLMVDSDVYSKQRLQLIKYLKNKKSNQNILLGGQVSRKNYLRELSNCKLIVSPFGWGEICYRDFEAILSGSILVKPNMSHVETYPNVFVPFQTYYPVNWSLTDLDGAVEEIVRLHDKYTELALAAQKVFLEFYDHPSAFVSHLKNILRVD